MIKQIVLFSFCFLLLSCSQKNDEVFCTEEFVYGLSITITDANSGEVITMDITVTAEDGNYTEELMAFFDFTNFVGAGERPGTYTIHISAEGYEEIVSQPIEVGANECHVIPEVRSFQLQPL
ncbi:carboxypeptidase-like regulatory domain-containing protein [Aureisphaera sp. CAU 1614]|uniref:Carboxypeptidase-like regulatory domain-containing protein n=1 Tax=Halomarinibacterium sedimenti TaxID=2857106 RepID=A0A9X1FMG5_9FLAO|nr:carboxypeptidase-like regulatory domain-containing protein [Halomarinibacterium sedimenti]MBW2937363.1 carboxypeptidase-like regulatory domain-containing protein [Halomarinibacterium sedimenti]